MSLLLAATLLAAQAAPAVRPAVPLPTDPAPSDWRPIPDDELMVMTLAGNRTVVVRLVPAALAPLHIANIRKIVTARWWDGASVYRVQENWVAQWGDATERKPLPPGVAATVAPEFQIATFRPAVTMARTDPHSAMSGITADGWPIAGDGRGAAWLTQCYGMVGVGRDTAPDSGSGAELYTPIGQSARRLDRNYAVVGRVIEGMRWLSALPRSDTPMGVYATAAERTPIVSVRLASELPRASRPRFAYRAADNPRFAAMVRARERPQLPTIGSGGIDVCEVPLAVRRTGS